MQKVYFDLASHLIDYSDVKKLESQICGIRIYRLPQDEDHGRICFVAIADDAEKFYKLGLFMQPLYKQAPSFH